MTPLQEEPSAHAPWTSTMFGRAFISVFPSQWGLTAMVRSEPLGAVCVTPLHLRMPVGVTGIVGISDVRRALVESRPNPVFPAHARPCRAFRVKGPALLRRPRRNACKGYFGGRPATYLRA